MKGIGSQTYLDSFESLLAEARTQDEDTARKLRKFAAVQVVRALGFEPEELVCPLRAA